MLGARRGSGGEFATGGPGWRHFRECGPELWTRRGSWSAHSCAESLRPFPKRRATCANRRTGAGAKAGPRRFGAAPRPAPSASGAWTNRSTPARPARSPARQRRLSQPGPRRAGTLDARRASANSGEAVLELGEGPRSLGAKGLSTRALRSAVPRPTLPMMGESRSTSAKPMGLAHGGAWLPSSADCPANARLPTTSRIQSWAPSGSKPGEPAIGSRWCFANVAASRPGRRGRCRDSRPASASRLALPNRQVEPVSKRHVRPSSSMRGCPTTRRVQLASSGGRPRQCARDRPRKDDLGNRGRMTPQGCSPGMRRRSRSSWSDLRART